MDLLKYRLMSLLMPSRKWGFLAKLPRNAMVVDVGCGNHSASIYKRIRPDIFYTGIDIMQYNMHREDIDAADQLIFTTKKDFAAAIESVGCADAVISSHNIEHVDDPPAVLRAMIDILKPGGLLYIATPSKASVKFPKRSGTLNFFDDPSHKKIISLDWIASLLTPSMRIIRMHEQYRPQTMFIIGLFLEPLSYARKKTYTGTWALYGFESIIWAQKSSNETRPLRSFG